MDTAHQNEAHAFTGLFPGDHFIHEFDFEGQSFFAYGLLRRVEGTQGNPQVVGGVLVAYPPRQAYRGAQPGTGTSRHRSSRTGTRPATSRRTVPDRSATSTLLKKAWAKLARPRISV